MFLPFQMGKTFHTAMKFWLWTISILWSKVGVIQEGLTDLKSTAMPWLSNPWTARHQSFQMRYYRTWYLRGLQSCRPSKLVVKKNSWYFGFEATFFAILCSNRRGPGSIPGRGGLWGLAALQPLDLQGCIIPHLKALMSGCSGVRGLGA